MGREEGRGVGGESGEGGREGGEGGEESGEGGREGGRRGKWGGREGGRRGRGGKWGGREGGKGNQSMTIQSNCSYVYTLYRSCTPQVVRTLYSGTSL